MQRKIENKIIFLDLPGGLSAIFKIKLREEMKVMDEISNIKIKNTTSTRASTTSQPSASLALALLLKVFVVTNVNNDVDGGSK